MKVIKFYETSGSLKLRVDTIEDLWAVQRIVFENDLVKSESLRRFKGNEGDTGEMKEVVIRLKVEKSELDKTAVRLRFMGKIVEGRPLEYVKLNAYHTLNIAPGDTLEITKPEWPDYLIQVVKNAVKDSRKPRLGIIAIDDEKMMPAYLYGYGLVFKDEIYSRLSKRMSQKDFTEQQNKYFNEIFEVIENMNSEIVIIAGPGFTKDELKKYAEVKGLMKKIPKRFFFFKISNVERTGIYELIKSNDVSSILEGDRMRLEFKLMGEFLEGLASGRSKSGMSEVKKALDNYEAGTILVNDSVLSDINIRSVLGDAEKRRVKIEIFNADDEAGKQLHSFKDIGCI
ncbi:MAG TPA: hypothetical protein VL944_01750 [Candidatus Acidoferrum sp.]|nr:hypothetical protein [Candidatus Acidoferrum sp.]